MPTTIVNNSGSVAAQPPPSGPSLFTPRRRTWNMSLSGRGTCFFVPRSRRAIPIGTPDPFAQLGSSPESRTAQTKNASKQAMEEEQRKQQSTLHPPLPSASSRPGHRGKKGDWPPIVVSCPIRSAEKAPTGGSAFLPFRRHDMVTPPSHHIASHRSPASHRMRMRAHRPWPLPQLFDRSSHVGHPQQPSSQPVTCMFLDSPNSHRLRSCTGLLHLHVLSMALLTDAPTTEFFGVPFATIPRPGRGEGGCVVCRRRDGPSRSLGSKQNTHLHPSHHPLSSSTPLLPRQQHVASGGVLITCRY